MVLGLWLGRRRDRRQDTVDDEPVDDRGVGEDDRMGIALPRGAEQRRHTGRAPRDHPRHRHLLRRPPSIGMLSGGEEGFGELSRGFAEDTNCMWSQIFHVQTDSEDEQLPHGYDIYLGLS